MEIKKKLENEKNIDLQCYRNNVGDIFITNIMRCRPHILIKKNRKFVCKKNKWNKFKNRVLYN